MKIPDKTDTEFSPRAVFSTRVTDFKNSYEFDKQ